MNNPLSPGDLLGVKPLPSSREAEMALLGAMIFDNAVIGDVLEVVNAAEAFAFPAHQVVFQELLHLHLERRPIDLVVLRDALARDVRLDYVGGADYLLALVEGLPNAANAEEYARTVHEKWVLRNIIVTCQSIIHQATRVTEDVDIVRDQAEKALFMALAKGEKAAVRTIQDLIHDTFDRIQELRDRKARLSGFSTGFMDLDELLSGLQPGQLYIVAGRPSMGKSSFAFNILENVVLLAKKPAMLFSLEMESRQVSQAILCSRARVDSALLRNGRTSDEEYERLQLAAGDFHEARLFIDDSPDLSALELRTRARRMKAREDIQLVVVDYLQRMHARQGNRAPESRQLEISMISSHLKSLAKELDVPVLAVAQLNRAAEGREDRKPLLSDLRESGAIEQDADAVMALYREEYYKPDTERKGMADVILLKNRTGPVGTVEMAFIKQYTRFENLATVGYPPRAA